MYCIRLSNGSYLDKFGGSSDLHACRSFTDPMLVGILAKSAGGIVCDEGIERAALSGRAYHKASVWEYAVWPVVSDWSNWAVAALAINGIVTFMDILTILNTRVQ